MADRYNSNQNRYANQEMPRERASWQEEQFQSDRSNRFDGDRYDNRTMEREPLQRDRDQFGSQSYQSRQGNRSSYSPLDDYDRASDNHASRQTRQQPTGMHGSFRGDSFGGEAMAGSYGQSEFGRGYGMTTGGTAYTGSTSDRGYRSDHDRGFFERAGDEIASWFGDDEAERRRRMDHGGRGPSNYTRSNERLLEEACETLTRDRGVDATNIQVTADNNEITLDGTVNTRWEKRRAEDAVHDISGVKHVQNNLRIAQAEMRAGTTPTNEA
ncbi:BON domain-containing protein [Aurantiacibacter luteus]|uniref:BON domain-containing protein n=1 Tax=Aurantiacibacter luteus TaxID=1581420 RepID=UPI00069BB7AE|nr:BON domain-containing protein [Aurantiacibacter luteus]